MGRGRAKRGPSYPFRVLGLEDPERQRLKEQNDCSVLALTCVSGASYLEAHAAMASFGRLRGSGVRLCGLQRVKLLGLRFRQIKAKGRRREAFRNYPAGAFILETAGHAFALVDGVVFDSLVTPGEARLLRVWLAFSC